MAKPVSWVIRHEALQSDCKVFQVFKQQCQHPHDHREGDFFTIRSPDWVLALPVTTDGQIVLVRQYRFGTRTLSWEPPGGILDPGEAPVEAAIRELEEETGFRGKSARLIGTCAPNPAIFGNTSHFILIEQCEPNGAVHLDANEEIEVARFSPGKAMDMIRSGDIHHAIAQAALLHLCLACPELF